MAHYVCGTCGATFATRQQLGGHHSGVCGAVQNIQEAVRRHALRNIEMEGNEPDNPLNDGPIQESLSALLQRPMHDKAKHIVRAAKMSLPRRDVNFVNTYKLHELQDEYEVYCNLLRRYFSKDFWEIFASVYDQRNGIIHFQIGNCATLPFG